MRDLLGHHFDDVEHLPVVVRECIRKLPKDDFKICFKTLMHRHLKCIKYVGEYFEKELIILDLCKDRTLTQDIKVPC